MHVIRTFAQIVLGRKGAKVFGWRIHGMVVLSSIRKQAEQGSEQHNSVASELVTAFRSLPGYNS